LNPERVIGGTTLRLKQTMNFKESIVVYMGYYTILALLTFVTTPDPVTGVRPTGDVGVRPLTATIPYAKTNQRSTSAAADTVVLFLPR
jgi:hypothetical protein